MTIEQDLRLIEDAMNGRHMAYVGGTREVTAAWGRIKTAAMTADTRKPPAFPSFLGIMIAVDPILAEGVIEFRDNAGNVLGTFKAEKRE
jgi:hypothetical protein